MDREAAQTFEDLIVWQTSLEEVRYYFILAKDLEYMARAESTKDVEEVARMLGAYTSTLLTPDS